MAKRVAFVTIGQSPRDDMVPEIVEHVRTPLAVTEAGALDGLTKDEIAAMRPRDDEHRLVTRLADGAEAVIGKRRTQDRLQRLFRGLDADDYDLVVLLCTGYFEPFEIRTPFLEAQLVVDNFVRGLSYNADVLGIMVPNERQIGEFHGIEGKSLRVSHASPYTGNRFGEAARELADTDLIVMHCMGYTEAMRREVARGARRPVLLSRRLVASAIDLMAA